MQPYHIKNVSKTKYKTKPFDLIIHCAFNSSKDTNNYYGLVDVVKDYPSSLNYKNRGFGFSIMSLRCSNNSGLLTNTYDGVLYAIQNGADVINMSYGSNHYSNTSQNLFNWANQNGIVLIASAGIILLGI